MGEGDRKAERIEVFADGSAELPEPFSCVPNPEFDKVPSLLEMTRAAIDYLQKRSTESFLLVVESASIDKQAHARRSCGQIGEVQQLDESVAYAIEFAEKNPNTLILVTADHGQAAKLIRQENLLKRQGRSFFSPGYFARLNTPEGGILGVNYATNNNPHFALHSGVQVPLLAGGEGFEPIPSFVQQSDIFSIISSHLGLD